MAELATPQFVGRYAIYGVIAQGGMASVHFGRLLGGGGFARTVAIKRLLPHLTLDAGFQASMLDEARMASRIHHPNVVPMLDVVTTEQEVLLVMEYVRGESVSKLLRLEGLAGRRLPLPVVSAVVVGALHGLHAAHEAVDDHGAPLGMVHRDISPQNVLLGVDGVPRVIDFGVAKAAGRLQTTADGAFKGKLRYLAPEQMAGGAMTGAVDVHAMGIVLWEMLTGERLFPGDSDVETLRLIRTGERPPPSRHVPQLSRGVDAVTLRALALDPRDRFPTARDMADALMQVIAPGFPADVGRWCAQVASESLSARAATVAQIESSSPSIPAPISSSPMAPSSMPRMPAPEFVRTAPDPSIAERMALGQTVLDPSSPLSARLVGAVRAHTSQMPAPMPYVPPPGAPRPVPVVVVRARGGRLASAGVLVLILGSIAVTLWAVGASRRLRPAPTRAIAASPALAAISVVDATSPARSAPIAVEASSTAAPPAVPSASVAGGPPMLRHHSKARTPTAAPPPSQTSADAGCKVEASFDADGNRRFTRLCPPP